MIKITTKIKLSLIATTIAVTLLTANMNFAHATPSLFPYIQEGPIAASKGTHTAQFNVCAGGTNLNNAVVLVSSAVTSTPIKIKDIGAGKCKAFSVQISANDPLKIQTKLIQESQLESMKNSLQTKIAELKSKVNKSEQSLSDIIPKNGNSKATKKLMGEEISKINALREQLKSIQKQYSVLSNLS